MHDSFGVAGTDDGLFDIMKKLKEIQEAAGE
jgi:hypothetical protein